MFTKYLKLFYISVLIIGTIIIFNNYCFSEEYEGINFPQGESSFADKIVSYQPTGGIDSLRSKPENALGKPDYSSNGHYGIVSLGDEGILVLQFVDNSLTTSGDDSPDLWIFEPGDIEPVSVDVSTNGYDWINVGKTSTNNTGIDIDAYYSAGIKEGGKYSFVKLTDLLPHQTGYPTTGSDIDAVGAISSTSPIYNQCEDSDGDGVIDEWDKCPNTSNLNIYVDKYGCPPVSDSSAVYGIVNMKGKPINDSSAMLIQSGELHQKNTIDDLGRFKFDKVAEDKSFSIIIRKKID